jgi:hypothetical protein
MRDRAAFLPFPQQRPQPCMHLAARTIPRFHPVQQTRIQTGRRTIAEGLLGRQRPAVLTKCLGDRRFQGSIRAHLMREARQIVKRGRQDETLRARQRSGIEISIDHGRVTSARGIVGEKTCMVGCVDPHTRAAECSGQSWSLATPSRAAVDLSEMPHSSTSNHRG